MSLERSPCFRPTHRLIPSRFPPVFLFDGLARPEDMEAAMELAGWTNDRLIAERVNRLPRESWPLGAANASVVMAAFLHVAPTGMRFNGPLLGGWYAGDDILTSVAEVGHHLRRETVALGRESLSREYRCYRADLDGDYVDLGREPEWHRALLDPKSYEASQAFGEEARAAGEAGILFPSQRRLGGMNVVAYIPANVRRVTQAEHFRLTVFSGIRRIEIERLPA
jgi:hypothetical protein